MNAKTEIMKLLSDGEEHRSYDILHAMMDLGMWFPVARVYPALRSLESAGRIASRKGPRVVWGTNGVAGYVTEQYFYRRLIRP